MHIVHVSNTFPGWHERVGGAEYEALHICERSRDRGDRVTVLTTAFDRHPAVELFDVRAVPLLETLVPFAARFLEVLKWYLLQFDPIAFAAVTVQLLRLRPDVVHVHNVYRITFAAIAAARLLGIPVVYSIYDYWMLCPNCIVFDHRRRPCRRFHGTWCVRCLPPVARAVQAALLGVRRAVFDFFLRMPARFVVLSRSSYGILRDYGIPGRTLAVIPLSLPDEFAGDDAEPGVEPNSVLFTGWMQHRKGVHVLLDAMDIVWRELPGTKLYLKVQRVKWEEEYQREAERRIRAAGASRAVLIEGHIPRQELQRLFRRAAVIVVPEQWENMSPLAVMEGMYLGKAIVAGDIGGFPELIENGVSGVLVPFDDPAAYAAAILRLLRNPDEASRIGRTAREHIIARVRRADPAGAMGALYHQVAGRRRRTSNGTTGVTS